MEVEADGYRAPELPYLAWVPYEDLSPLKLAIPKNPNFGSSSFFFGIFPVNLVIFRTPGGSCAFCVANRVVPLEPGSQMRRLETEGPGHWEVFFRVFFGTKNKSAHIEPTLASALGHSDLLRILPYVKGYECFDSKTMVTNLLLHTKDLSKLLSRNKIIFHSLGILAGSCANLLLLWSLLFSRVLLICQP